MPVPPLNWPSIAAAGFPFPTDVPARRVADELAAMLVSPDPAVRDGHAYTAIARWLREGHFDGLLVEIGDTAAERFTHPEIQARTFAPLVLARVLDRAVTLPEPNVTRWYTAFAAWYPTEDDTRGWDPTLGWLHAVAHGADAAAALAGVLPDRAPGLLELCARRMTAESTRYVQLEDARLARAITTILHTPGLPPTEAIAWLATVSDAFTDAAPGPVPPWAFNTFATLQSLHLHLTRGLTGHGRPPHTVLVADRVTAILRGPFPWLA
jgi:Protein of unknown function (DUF2785)